MTLKHLPENFKPMLAAKLDSVDDAKFPAMVSPKLDGIRAISTGNGLVSRTLKPIPNEFIQQRFASLPPGLDGELIVGAPTGTGVMNATASGVMKKTGMPDATFHVFDKVCEGPFMHRHNAARDMVAYWQSSEGGTVKIVRHTHVHMIEELEDEEDFYIKQGYEGLMLRDLHGEYKFGRSGKKQGWLLKLKRWHDTEAVITGAVEEMANNNEATKDELGRTKRSSAKANKTGKGRLGALECILPNGVEFELGTGFDAYHREWMWKDRVALIGQHVKFKYQEFTPAGVPRFPVFLGLRHKEDMS